MSSSLVSQAGWSLLEMNVSIALLIVLLSISSLSFYPFYQLFYLEKYQYDLIFDIGFARKQSLIHHQVVYLCPLQKSKKCTLPNYDCAEVGWSCGWAVVLEREGKPIFLRIRKGHSSIQIQSQMSDLIFAPPLGSLLSGFRTYQLTLPSMQGKKHCIRISSAGRIRLGCDE